MSIERRYNKRIEYRHQAQIVYGGRGFPVTIKNLSAEGMFLETHLLTIPTGNLVELEFTLGEQNWSISALVIHANRHGLGVAFKTSQPELPAEVKRLLRNPPPLVFGPALGINSNPSY
ncbi:MAG: PilZ domain-containing protein [Chromatiales bacterium]|nr:PilZ domain-containing protein [Chromatiales bacterium]